LSVAQTSDDALSYRSSSLNERKSRKRPETAGELQRAETIFKKIVSLFVVTRIVQAFSGLFFFLTVDDCLTQKSPTV